MINRLIGWLNRRKRLRAEAAIRNEAAIQAVELARAALADASRGADNRRNAGEIRGVLWSLPHPAGDP